MALNGLGLRVYACFGAVGLLSASISSEWYELEAEAIPRVREPTTGVKAG